MMTNIRLSNPYDLKSLLVIENNTNPSPWTEKQMQSSFNVGHHSFLYEDNNDNVIGESPSFSTSKLNKQISFYNDHYLTKSFDIAENCVDPVRYATNEHVDGKNSGSGDAKTSKLYG